MQWLLLIVAILFAASGGINWLQYRNHKKEKAIRDGLEKEKGELNAKIELVSKMLDEQTEHENKVLDKPIGDMSLSELAEWHNGRNG
jgi:hypothetical protein